MTLADLREYNALQQSMPERARMFRELPWVNDGLVVSERRAAQELIRLGLQWGDVFLGLMEKPWLAEGITKDKETVITSLVRVANAGSFSGSAVEITGMPFLDSVQSVDALAMTSLGRLALRRQDVFRQVMSHPTVSDGITDDETKIVAVLGGSNPTLVQTLLNPQVPMLEEREIEVRESGKLLITIIRTQPGAERTMDLAEEAIRNISEFMATPWPTQNVIFLYVRSATPSFAGVHKGTYMEIKSKHGAEDVSPHYALHLLTHELGHYFWTNRYGQERWIVEGGADLLSAVSLHARYGWPVAAIKTPCAHVRSIQELEEQDYSSGDPLHGCTYRLGSRLLLDLYHQMDPTTFRLGFRRLYLLSQHDDETGACDSVRVGICHLEAAFKAEATQEVTDSVDEAVARWYYGTEPLSTRKPVQLDNDPVDPVLPSINARVSQAYVSGQAAGDIRLHLEFSDAGSNVGSPSDAAMNAWPLEIVEYSEEDGLMFGRRSYQKPEGVGGSGTTRRWYSLRANVPGQYRVYAYWDGQKIAEASYEVKPADEVVTIQGKVVGPNNQPLEGIGLWAWQGTRADSRFGRTKEDGSFAMPVPDGSFTLLVYAPGEGCTFVGRYGPGGFTTVREDATHIEVDGESVQDIVVRLPERPDALPRIEHCA